MNKHSAVEMTVSLDAFNALHAAICRVLRKPDTKSLQRLADALIGFDEEAWSPDSEATKGEASGT